MTYFYFVCDHCNAKWFTDQQTCDCPRCTKPGFTGEKMKPPWLSEPKLITADELAGMLNVSERTLWRLLSKGELPEPVRLGGSTRWKLEEVSRWIAEGCPPMVHGKN